MSGAGDPIDRELVQAHEDSEHGSKSKTKKNKAEKRQEDSSSQDIGKPRKARNDGGGKGGKKGSDKDKLKKAEKKQYASDSEHMKPRPDALIRKPTAGTDDEILYKIAKKSSSYRPCAGCVPVRKRSDGNWEVLLVQSRWTPEVWLYPKGGIEESEDPKLSGLRETREEAGVIGKCGPKLGVYNFSSVKQSMTMYILFVDEEFADTDARWKERKVRIRAWYSLEEAKKIFKGVPDKLYRPELVKILKKTKNVLKTVDETGHEFDEIDFSGDSDDLMD